MSATRLAKQVSGTAALLLVGTGSFYPLDYANEWKDYLSPRSDFVVDVIPAFEHADTRSPAHHLQNIKDVLSLNISEIASFLQVSRQSIYKWLSDTSKPEPDKLIRIKTLSYVADAFKEVDIQRGGALLGVKIINGQSLLDIIQSGKPYKEALLALIQEAKITRSNYQKSALSQSRGHATNDWQSSISIPSYREDI